jgi:hypothetical protein
MGEIAEYYGRDLKREAAKEELEIERQHRVVEEMERKYLTGVLKWETQFDGGILVSKMTDQHIINTIQYLKKKKPNYRREKWLELFYFELEKR